jgi:hypothetical protein
MGAGDDAACRRASGSFEGPGISRERQTPHNNEMQLTRPARGQTERGPCS